MAFTEAGLFAQLDSDASGRRINIQEFIPGPTNTDLYVIGVVAPYAGRSRWVTVPSSANAALAAIVIVAALA